jgi:hypothetical protein
VVSAVVDRDVRAQIAGTTPAKRRDAHGWATHGGIATMDSWGFSFHLTFRSEPNGSKARMFAIDLHSGSGRPVPSGP